MPVADPNYDQSQLALTRFCSPGSVRFLFFYGLGQFGLIGADEPRYAQVAREMLQHHDWVTPTLGGQPWLEKPPLYYWQAMLAYAIFGVSDWAARLPAAMDATLLVFAVYFFLRRFRAGIRVGRGAHRRFLRRNHWLRARRFHGHGTGFCLHRRNAQLVGVAR